jgi:hypothetical protein
MSDTVRTTLIAGIFGLLGAVGGAAITGRSQVELAQQKFNSDLVMRALESSSADQRLESLILLVETNLLKDAEVQKGVRVYAEARKNNPASIPRVISGAKLKAPIISNPRIFLLAGVKQKEALFPLYKTQLEAAGYKVLGQKSLDDPGRPSTEEVRYFFPKDKSQAEKIAEFVKFNLNIPTLDAKLYSDPSVNPGYIEIWFGK